MSINKGKDVVGNSDFDVNQLNQVVQDVNLDSNDQGGCAVSSTFGAPIRRTLVVPAGKSYGKRKGLKEVVKDKKIVWPPSVVIMNTRVEQDENDMWLGMGNQELLDYFGSYQAVRAHDAYGPRGHRGMSLLIFETSAVGYTEAERLSKHFEDLGTDRDAWEHRPQMFYPAGKRQLYGYMATKRDMEIFNMHSQGKSKMKFEMVSYLEKVVDQLKQMNEDNQQLIWNKNKVAKEQMPSKALKELFGSVSQKLRKTDEDNRQVRERTKLLHNQNKEEMSTNKGKDVVGNSDFDVNQLNQVVQYVTMNKGGNVAAAIQAPKLNPWVQPAGRGGAPVRPPTNVWANPAGAVNYNPTPTAIPPPLSSWNWNSRPQPPAVEEDDVDESDDDYDTSDDEVLSDEYDSDEKPKSHGERKKNKWHAEFFITLDKLSVEQINEPDRQWHCPACKNGPGAIDWYKSLPSLVTHAKTKGTKRVNIHMDLAELLEEELRIKGALVVPATESYDKGLNEVVKDKKIVWPPSVVTMNTRVDQDENDKFQDHLKVIQDSRTKKEVHSDKLLQEAPIRVDQAYSAMDPEKRGEKLEETKESEKERRSS